MPNTYTQIHIHAVFAVKNRQSIIHDAIRVRVEKYFTGIVQNSGHKLLSIYCMPDHAHLFIGFRPTQSLSDLMREVKSRSAEFINQEKLTTTKFNWQEGYGAFSYSHSHVQNVIDYVLHQPEHHRKKTFQEEYLELLRKFEVSYDEKYLFDWIEPCATPTEPQEKTWD
jgi:REP element-mobilizing transposase RayT